MSTQQGATFFELYCDPKERFNRGELYYWVWFFHLTKYYELLDTLFIVLKKVCVSCTPPPIAHRSAVL